MRYTTALTMGLVALACLVSAEVPLLGDQHPNKINGQYILVFKDNAPSGIFGLIVWLITNTLLSIVHFTYDFEGRRGMTAKLAAPAMPMLRQFDKALELIEADRLWELNPPERATQWHGLVGRRNAPAARQTYAPWNLARLSQAPSVAGVAAKDLNYLSPASGGTNMSVYVVDTGIYVEHQEFGSPNGTRAKFGASFVPSATRCNQNGQAASTCVKDPSTGKSYVPVYHDDNGHGTHCAGTIAGRNVGVAKFAEVIAVKVMDQRGVGSTSSILQGLEWVYNDAKKMKAIGKSIVSMSIGGDRSDALDAYVKRMTDQGIICVVAAGNEARNVDLVSPARVSEAITIGAIDITDTFANFSNYGPIVDIMAPGVDILSAWNSAPDMYAKLSGTSMATPHAAGVAALIIPYVDSEPDGYVSKVQALMKSIATPRKIKGLPENTPNSILHNGFLKLYK